MFGVPGADELLRGSLLHMSDSRALAHWLTHTALGRKLASRFVAGETLDSAVVGLRDLHVAGIRASLDHLGEAVTNPAEAIDAATEYVRILEWLREVGAMDRPARGKEVLDCNVSLKLTQMGLGISRTLCTDNLLRILDAARNVRQFVRLDMESSRHTEDTLEVFEDVWARGYDNCGIVLQAYLRRTERHVERAVELGCRVRLCKGAYAEPPAVAFTDKHDTDANYLRLARRLLDAGHFPAMATHDPRIIREIESWRPDPTSFEFQMLYGVRPEVQRRLAASGWGMRAYVPFGSSLVKRVAVPLSLPSSRQSPMPPGGGTTGA